MKTALATFALALVVQPFWRYEPQNQEYDYFREGHVCAVVSITDDGKFEGYSLKLSGGALVGLSATTFDSLSAAKDYAAADCPE